MKNQGEMEQLGRMREDLAEMMLRVRVMAPVLQAPLSEYIWSIGANLMEVIGSIDNATRAALDEGPT